MNESSQSVNITPESWEAICIELNRNPIIATKHINEFKETNEKAYELSQIFLQSPICSPFSKFHACSVYQYVLLNKQWNIITNSTEKLNTQSFIWNLIITACQYDTTPLYLLKKLFQTSVLIWKRSWCENNLTSEEKVFYLIQNQILTMLNTSQSVHPTEKSLFRYACIYMLVLIEEFSSYRSVDIILPLEFHRQTHIAFENVALDKIMYLSYECFQKSFTQYSLLPTENVQTILSPLTTILDTTNLMLEILYWDFGAKLANQNQSNLTYSNTKNDQDRYNQLLATYPIAWLNMFSSIEFINQIFYAYDTIRSLIPTFQSSPSETYRTCHTDALIGVSNLIIALCSINYQDKNTVGIVCHTIGIQLIGLINQCIASNGQNHSQYYMSIREKEYNQLAIAIQKYFSTYDLDILYISSHFERLLMCLAQITFNIAQELASIASSFLQLANKGKNMPIDSEFMGNWRMECIVLFLHSWCNILENPIMFSWLSSDDRNHGSNSDNNSNDNHHAQIVTAASAFVSASTKGVDMNQLKKGLQSIGYDVFGQLYEAVLNSTLYDSLSYDNEEEEDENEAINERSFDELVHSIATIGRSSFISSMGYVTQSLNGIGNRISMAMTQNSNNSNKSNHHNVIQMNIDQISVIDQNNQNYSTSSLSSSSLSLEWLEMMRIGILFASHLIDDNYISETNLYNDVLSIHKNSNSNNTSLSSDTPMIPSFIIDSFIQDSITTTKVLHTIVMSMSQHLQLQIQILSTSSLSSHSSSNLQNKLIQDLFSPMIVSLLLRFFASYLGRYCNNDRSGYDEMIQIQVPGLFSIHGEEFNEILDVLLHSIHILITKLPHELRIISASSELILSLATLSHRYDYIGNHEALVKIYTSIINFNDSNSNSDHNHHSHVGSSMMPIISLSNLSSDSLCILLRSLVKFQEKSSYPKQYIEYMHNYILSRMNKIIETKLGIEQLIGCIRGLSVCTYGEEGLHQSLFNQSIAILLTNPNTYDILSTNDDILQFMVCMIRDYAEYQIGSLPTLSAKVLYIATYHILYMASNRLHQPQTIGQSTWQIVTDKNSLTIEQQSELEYRSDMILLLLQLLNHLSVRDFLLSDTDTENIVESGSGHGKIATLPSAELIVSLANITITSSMNLSPRAVNLVNHHPNHINSNIAIPVNAMNSMTMMSSINQNNVRYNVEYNIGLNKLLSQPFDIMIGKILFYGINLFIPMMSPDFLRSYPNTCNRYFSFLNFLLSAYELEFAEYMIGMNVDNIERHGTSDTNYSMFTVLCEHLLWGIGVIDPIISRISLQSIQSIGTFQYQSMKQGSEGYGITVAIQNLFSYIIDRLLHILIFPNLSDYGITWDRIEPYGNALLVWIVFDMKAYMVSAQNIIQSQPLVIQSVLSLSFQKLISERNIVLDRIDRKNRQIFVQNLKDFYNEVRPLVVYKQ